MSWKVTHACVRGSAHVRSGLPNQDAAQCIMIPGEGSAPAIAVAVVSDGHGGARHFRSQIGSSLAVSTAVDVVQAFLSRHTSDVAESSIQSAEVEELQRALVDSWLAAVSSDLENHPLSDDELKELEEGDGRESRTAVETQPALAYGATLLLAAATDNLILYLQLGDGDILSVAQGGETTRPLPADERLLGNQTTSLCQPEAWREFRSAWSGAPDLPALVLLSTDGYLNSFRSDGDFLKIGADYLEILREQGIETLGEELPAILAEATRQGSGDDITLAILQGEPRKNVAEANGAPVKPKISGESRSALIEQLKARHSSQHRRLDELSSQLEQTRKDNRRLQFMILVLILVVLGAALYFFRGMFHSSLTPNPDLKPQGTTPRGGPSGQPQDAPPAPTAPSRAGISAWRLELAGRAIVTLKQGLEIQTDEIIGGGSEEGFARVAMKKDKMRLINDSQYVWTVVSSTGKKFSIKNGEDFVLGTGRVDITFAKGVAGKVTPIIEKPVAQVPDDRPDASVEQPQQELN